MAAPGTVWETDTWDDDAWADNTWADAEDPPISSVTGNGLTTGVFALEQNVSYPLPGRTVRIAYYITVGSMQFSNDGTHWLSIVGNANKEFQVSHGFIRVISGTATISIKEVKRKKGV